MLNQSKHKGMGQHNYVAIEESPPISDLLGLCLLFFPSKHLDIFQTNLENKSWETGLNELQTHHFFLLIY